MKINHISKMWFPCGNNTRDMIRSCPGVLGIQTGELTRCIIVSFLTQLWLGGVRDEGTIWVPTRTGIVVNYMCLNNYINMIRTRPDVLGIQLGELASPKPQKLRADQWCDCIGNMDITWYLHLYVSHICRYIFYIISYKLMSSYVY